MDDERRVDPNITLLAQMAITAILWAATFVATKSDWIVTTRYYQ